LADRVKWSVKPIAARSSKRWISKIRAVRAIPSMRDERAVIAPVWQLRVPLGLELIIRSGQSKHVLGLGSSDRCPPKRE